MCATQKIFKLSVLVFLFHIFSANLFAQNPDPAPDDTSTTSSSTFSFTIRLGQGGFSDSRSDIGKLGGGQVSLDVRMTKYPVVLSITSEYYTNSADPTHSYEISGLVAANLLYTRKLFNWDRVNFFVGGGLGRLGIPKGEGYPDKEERGMVLNTEVGINAIVFWKIGLYSVYKYLYANNNKRINFSEHILLLGITFNFS